MLQQITVILIITGTIAYLIYALVKSLSSKNKPPCDDCTGCDIKQEILKSYRKDEQKNPFRCNDFKSTRRRPKS